MRTRIVTGAAVLALLIPAAAYAQTGVVVGAPPGAVVGSTTVVVGGFTDANMPKFREYVVREHIPSYRYTGDIVVGAELPMAGVTYYEVPPEYNVREYRYTIVNDRTVLVDPRTHRIVQIIGG